MLSALRKNCFSLLLILVVSHVALTLHVTTHIPIEQSNCEICAGQTDPTHAIPFAATELLQSIAYNIEFGYSAPTETFTEFTAYRQRGPPLISS